MLGHKINVTKTFLPPIDEYEEYVKQIWANGQLTNQGPLLHEFEEKAQRYLNTSNFHFVANGTLALQVALRSLDITEGEIITTPFSYVATVSSILWEQCEPIFADIEPTTYCMDADNIEKLITPKTKAIMPVHVFGNPCDVDKIEAIARRHNLPVIYDAAHAFGVRYKGKQLLDYGDISTCSFHATKLFHTIEGGCVIAKRKSISDKVELIRRFGHQGDDHYMLGMNAKASEFQAAMGLCNLKHLDEIIKNRKDIFEAYSTILEGYIKTPTIKNDTDYNYAYYPIVARDEAQVEKIMNALAAEEIFPRRYFFPSLNTLPYLKTSQTCPISEDIASKILCLPLYVGLELQIAKKIASIVKARCVN